MKRYIDVDKIINKYEEASKELYNELHKPNSWSEAYDCIIADLDEEPVASVREVICGHWDGYSTTMMECSICKKHVSKHKYNFCPECGATMVSRETSKQNTDMPWEQITFDLSNKEN